METVTLREGETLEQDRLATGRLFDLLDLGYCRTTPLKLFGYRIFVQDEKEMVTGYYWAEDGHEDCGGNGYDLFIINFDTNDEGDGIGFVEPIDHDGIKTQIEYAKSREFYNFHSKNIIPFDPVYSFLVHNDYILPFESQVHGAERESLEFEEFSGKLEKIDLEKDLDWIISNGATPHHRVMNDFFEVTTDLDEATLKSLGEKIMSLAIQRGVIEFTPGVFIYDNKVLIEKQTTLPENDTGKNIDYTEAPFWILLRPEGTISPCNDPMEVIDFFGLEEVDE